MEIINIENLDLIEEEIQSIKLIKDDTYDIEVEDVHHYILSNGIISHNTGIYAGIVSGGIEPVFMKQYTRWSIVVDNDKRKLLEKGIKFPDTSLQEWFETDVFKFSKRGDEQILRATIDDTNYEIDKNRGLIKATDVIDYGYKWLKDNLSEEEFEALDEYTLGTTTTLTVDEHIDILNIVSHYTDMNSSKTVNLPNDYPYNDFKKLYMNGWENNIKGLTTYRAGTMTAVLEEKKEIVKYQTELEKMFIAANGNVIEENVKIPTEYFSKGYVIKDRNKKKWYFNVAFADSSCKKPFALFITTNGRTRGEVADNVIETMEVLLRKNKISEILIDRQKEKCANESNINKVARSISMALRHNISIVDIVNVLDTCHDGFATVLFATKKILSKFIQDGAKIKGEKCPNCDRRTLIYQEGCVMCSNCSWTKC